MKVSLGLLIAFVAVARCSPPADPATKLPVDPVVVNPGLVQVYEKGYVPTVPVNDYICSPHCHEEIYDKPVYVVTHFDKSRDADVTFYESGLRSIHPFQRGQIVQSVGKKVAYVYTKYDFPVTQHPHVLDVETGKPQELVDGKVRAVPYVLFVEEGTEYDVVRGEQYHYVADIEFSVNGLYVKGVDHGKIVKRDAEIDVTTVAPEIPGNNTDDKGNNQNWDYFKKNCLPFVNSCFPYGIPPSYPYNQFPVYPFPGYRPPVPYNNFYPGFYPNFRPPFNPYIYPQYPQYPHFYPYGGGNYPVPPYYGSKESVQTPYGVNYPEYYRQYGSKENVQVPYGVNSPTQNDAPKEPVYQDDSVHQEYYQYYPSYPYYPVKNIVKYQYAPTYPYAYQYAPTPVRTVSTVRYPQYYSYRTPYTYESYEYLNDDVESPEPQHTSQPRPYPNVDYFNNNYYYPYNFYPYFNYPYYQGYNFPGFFPFFPHQYSQLNYPKLSGFPSYPYPQHYYNYPYIPFQFYNVPHIYPQVPYQPYNYGC